MSRIILGVGAAIDTLLSGVSLCGYSESYWSLTLCLGTLTVFSSFLILMMRIWADAFAQPDVLPCPISQRRSRDHVTPV